MGGALLRSGSLRDFHALGAVGNPVFSSASQLRAAIRRQMGIEVGNLFAIPKLSEDGSSIDWYAPMDGDVVPWSSATPEERASAKAELVAAQQRLSERSAALQAEDDSERQIFGRLLAQATSIPSDEHVYLVDDRPVLTFWGFTERGAAGDRDVIGSLAIGGGVATPPAPPPTSGLLIDNLPNEDEPNPRRLPWWLWLLLLLLLLLLALLGLRACGMYPFAPEEPSGIEPAAVDDPQRLVEEPVDQPPVEQVPLVPRGDVIVDQPIHTESITTVPGEALDGELGLDEEPVPTGPPVPAEEMPTAETPSEEVLPEAMTPQAIPPEETLPEESPAEEMPPDDVAPEGTPPDEVSPETPPPAPPPSPLAPEPPAPRAAEAPLSVPESAVESGSTEFLDGQWRSVTGLQDADTGKPIQLNYDFTDGKGSVTLSHGTGASRQTCSGPVSSSIDGGKLSIQHDTIACPDGTTFERSRVECAVGDGGRADCKGINEDKSTYDVQIVR